MKLFAAVLALVLLVFVVKSLFFSFRAQKPEDYAQTGPAFVMQTHLNGEILSEGLIYGPTGKMTNSFVAKMRGEWNGNTGTLTEDFTYSNGNKQTRKWFLTLQDETSFTATAEDIVGEAVGTISGSTIKMEYTIILSQDAGGHKLRVTDWLYLAENGVILNRSELRMFGLKVAELVATMRPE